MNTLKTTVLLVLGVSPIFAAEIDSKPVTLPKAKEMGRVKSRFLKEKDRWLYASGEVRSEVKGLEDAILNQ